MRPLLMRLAGFVSIPLIASVSPLLMLPIVSRASTTPQWAAINVGQALGGLALSVITFGWVMVGPSRVSLAETREHRRTTYADSFWIKCLVAALVALPGLFLCHYFGPPGEFALAAGMFAATAFNAFTIAWYAVGVGAPSLVVRHTLIPQIIGVAATAVTVLLTGWPYWFAVCTLVFPMVGVALFHLRLFGRLLPPAPSWGRTTHLLRRDAMPAVVNAIGSVYTSAPVPLASRMYGTSSAAAFGSADKLYRYGLFAVSSVGDGLQSWVVSARENVMKKQMVAVIAHLVIGLSGGLFLFLAGPWASGLLFGGEKKAPHDVLGYYGLAYFAVSLSTPFIRNVLVPTNHSGTVFRANLGGLVVGALLLWLNHDDGPLNIAEAFAATEVVTMLLCVGATLAFLRRSEFLTTGAAPYQNPREKESPA